MLITDSKIKTRSESNLAVVWTLIVRLALIAAFGYFVYRVRSIMVAVILAVMLSYAVLPSVEFLCRCRVCKIGGRRTRRLIATTIVFVALLLLCIFSVKLFLAPFGKEVSELAKNFNSYVSTTKMTLAKASDWYNKLPPDVQEFLRKQDFGKVTSGLSGFSRNIISNTLQWAAYIVDIILIPVLAFYFVLDSRSLRRDFLALVPRRRRREALMITRNVAVTLQSYIVGQFILCLIAGVITAVVLSQFRMDYILVLSIFAAVTRAIPIVGPLMSGVPIILLGVATRSTDVGLWLMGYVVVMHFVESKFIMPKLIGERMHLHPAIVIIVLLIGAEFFGVLGMFLAAPVAAVIRELIRFYIIRPRRQEDQLESASTPELVGASLRSDKM